MKKNILLLIGFVCIAFGAHAQRNISPSSHAVSTVGQANQTFSGRVVSARPVQVEGTRNIGRTTGVIAGGVAGSAIGGSTRANILGGVGGAVVGGVAGGAIESGLTRQTGIEYVVELDGGMGLVTIVQGPDPALGVGQRVLVISGPPARVIADTRVR